jgi:pSer/pThr/pTyr-binding forkhead associated (FHA) protein
VSGEHALIVTILNDSFLEDLGSTNGTLVNGVPIKKHILQHNDVIEIGKYKLKYLTEQAVSGTHSAQAADYEKTMVIRPGMAARAAQSGTGPAVNAAAAHAAATSTQPAPARSAFSQPVHTSPAPVQHAAAATASAAVSPAAAATATPVAKQYVAPPTENHLQPQAPAAATGQLMGAIQILSGPSAGKELELVKNLTTLGRPGVQVAVITRRPQGYFITHVEGGNFPIVNGKTLDAQAHPLRDHDVVELAGVKMEFFHKGG